MSAHLIVDFVLGGAVGWLLVVCWRQRVMIHDLRSRLMLTRPMTMAELQMLTNEEMRAFAENVRGAKP
jgi:hypothetical protein